MKNLLTIAGSDSSGGAGIQADLKTFAAHGTFGMSVITAVTAQNTCGVAAVQNIDCDIVEAQISAVFDDIRVDAVKIGMVSQPEIIRTIAACLRRYQPRIIVVDPVMISKSGYPLLAPEACETLIGYTGYAQPAGSRGDYRYAGYGKGADARSSGKNYCSGCEGCARKGRSFKRYGG
mgnify:CR=1 FL=1